MGRTSETRGLGTEKKIKRNSLLNFKIPRKVPLAEKLGVRR